MRRKERVCCEGKASITTKAMAFLLLLLLLFGTVSLPINAETNGTGDHIVICQVYGGSDNGVASHSFIELYNPTTEAIDLTGWSIQYRSSSDGPHGDSWHVFPLQGTIAAGEYFLIRCGAVTDTSEVEYQVPEGNLSWNIPLHNKGLSVVLMNNTKALDDAFKGNVLARDFQLPEGFVDLAAAQGNDETSDQAPPAWEGSYAGIQSKKKAIRRDENATDSNDNGNDFHSVDYSEPVSETEAPHSIAPDATGTHLLIEQVYADGGENQDGTPIANSFVELYNPTTETIALEGWTLAYSSPRSGGKPGSTDGKVVSFTLDGEKSIPSGGSYLIVVGETKITDSEQYCLPEADQRWETQEFDNKVYMLVLQFQGETVDSIYAGDESTILSDAAVEPAEIADNWVVGISKQKSVRRVGHVDTDSPSDFSVIDWREQSDLLYAPRNSAGESGNLVQAPEFTPVETTDNSYSGFFDTEYTWISLSGRYNAGAMNPDGGSAEIVAYNADADCCYVVNGIKGTLDFIAMDSLNSEIRGSDLQGTEIDIAAMTNGIDGFAYGDMTSVAVSTEAGLVAVALQDADYTKTGRIAVFTYDGAGVLTLAALFEAGVQPDMVTFTPDGGYILCANEGEPRLGYEAEDPEGSVTVVQIDSILDASRVETIGFHAYDASEEREVLTSAGIIIKKGALPSKDLEPEYIAATEETAYIALQEANAIAVLDLASCSYQGIYSVGLKDFGEEKNAIDLLKDETIALSTQPGVYGIRMPDGIALYETDGQTYLLTANEGDSRDWPGYSNEIESTLSPDGKVSLSEAAVWYDASDVDGLPATGAFIFGGRSFSLYRVDTDGLHLVFDSGDAFERITSEVLPDYFNCSNDKTGLDNRSGKKGPEPESIVIGSFQGKTYAFIALERIGGIMQYDITDPNEISFVNYINSRDFSAPIKDDVSPEGLYFIGAEESPTGMPMLLAACEVSGTVAAYSLSRGCTVTFVADGKVVGQTEVAYGGTLAELPDIPAKVGYEATPPVWDTEDFSGITDDLIVTAVYVKDPTPDEKPDGDVSNGDGTNVNLPGGDKKDPDSEIAANAPETGDFSNWVLWVGVLILVVGLLDALLILRQKRRDI